MAGLTFLSRAQIKAQVQTGHPLQRQSILMD